MPPSASYPRRFGSYVLLEPLGSGGMSEVDLARRTVGDAGYVRFAVIKRIQGRLTGDAGFVGMFQDEARINAELQHENIAQVYDFGRVGEEWYIAMEYVAGMDMRRLMRLSLRQGSALPQRIGLRILADVLSALQYAHSRVDTYGRPMNIVHRDVNPRNIMVSVRGEVKLIDFGVAKSDTRMEHTQGQTIKGKFAYMAPEQIEGASPADGRADLFAVGLLLQEILEGEHPFTGLSGVQIVHRVLAGELKPLEDTGAHPEPELLRTVWRTALAYEREARYPTAATFRTAIEAAAAPLGGIATRVELAAYVQGIDVKGAADIAHRLTAYRTQQAPAELPPPPPAPLNPSQPSEPSVSAATEATVAAPAAGRWPLIIAVAAGGAGGALALSLLLAIVILALPTGTPAQVVEAPKIPLAPEPALAPEPVPPEAPEPAALVDPVPTRSPDPKPTARPTSSPEKAQSEAVPAASPKAPTPADPPPEAVPEPAAPAEPPAPAEPEVGTAKPETAPPPPAATETGYLFATSHPSSGMEVVVDGTVVGRTPLRNHKLGIGSHTVLIRDPATGRSTSHAVQVTKGRATMIRGESP